MGNREKLLEGAKRCIYEIGFARTTARDLVATSGTNLASIGYHFGSKEALLTQAMIEELGQWGAELASVLPGNDEDNDEDAPLTRLESMWTRVIESFTARRALWFATFEAFAEAERSPALHELLASGYELARPWMAALFMKGEVSDIDEQMARSVGSFLLALQAGLAAQWLLDPGHSPSGHDIAEALRRILAVVEAAESGDA
jgi:AcrR family transcriptional regulator